MCCSREQSITSIACHANARKEWCTLTSIVLFKIIHLSWYARKACIHTNLPVSTSSVPRQTSNRSNKKKVPDGACCPTSLSCAGMLNVSMHRPHTSSAPGHSGLALCWKKSWQHSRTVWHPKAGQTGCSLFQSIWRWVSQLLWRGVELLISVRSRVISITASGWEILHPVWHPSTLPACCVQDLSLSRWIAYLLSQCQGSYLLLASAVSYI